MVRRGKIKDSLWVIISLLLLVLWILSEIEHRQDTQEYINTVSTVVRDWNYSVTTLENKFAALDSVYKTSLGIGGLVTTDD